MDNQKQKKKSVMDTLSATMVLVLIALLLVFVGYTYLALKNGYTLDDLIDNFVGNLIGVLAAFLLFDILNNKLTQDAYARETSQQITKTLMGEPEILDSFSDEDKKSNRIRAVSLAMLSTGCFKVVNDGITYFPISTPSKPVREISSGTLYPASDNAFPAPIASISEIAKIAVHGICFSRNSFVTI